MNTLLAPGAEVAGEDVPVEGVHGRPRPGRRRAARPRSARSRRPSPCACGGRLRWRRLTVRRSSRTAVASASGDSSRCSAGSRTTGTPRSWATYSIDSSPSASVPATIDDLVAARPLPRGELDHVQRRAADVQPRDRVHDRQAGRLAGASSRCRLGRATAGRGEHGEGADEPEREPEQRRHRRPAEERRAGDRAEERAEPGRRQVGGELVGVASAANRAPSGSESRAATAIRASEQREADDPELVGDLVEGLLRDERPVGGREVAGGWSGKRARASGRNRAYSDGGRLPHQPVPSTGCSRKIRPPM